MHPNIVGALINSALYIVMVFVAGLVTGHPLAWKYAVACAGIAFFSHVTAIIQYKITSQYLVFVSWGVGALAGIALLF